MRYVKGIICPKFGKMELGACKECKLKFNFVCYPPPLLFYLYDEVERESVTSYDYSVTELLDCPRKLSIAKNGIYVNPDRIYQLWKGIIGHNIMAKWARERPGFETYIEHRFYVKFKSQKLKKEFILSLKPDRLDVRINDKKAILYDFKFVKNLPSFHKPYSNHKIQVEFYHTLLKFNGITVAKIHLIYMTFDEMISLEIPVPETPLDYEIEKRLIMLEKKVPVVFDVNENWRCKFCEVSPICMLELVKENYDITLRR